MDIEIDISKEYLASSSSRGASVNFTISSMDYANQVQVQANNLTWAKQVENREIQSLSLFYVPLKKVITDTMYMELIVKPIYILYTMEINNTNISQGLKLLVISY